MKDAKLLFSTKELGLFFFLIISWNQSYQGAYEHGQNETQDCIDALSSSSLEDIDTSRGLTQSFKYSLSPGDSLPHEQKKSFNALKTWVPGDSLYPEKM